MFDWTDANLRWVLSGTILLGVAAAVLGCFAFLRGRSLIGDALAHAALPGVCIAYLLTGTRDMAAFIFSATVSGLAAVGSISGITRLSRIKDDSALAIVLSVFFGFGIVLLTHIQHMESHPGMGEKSGIDKFLFGQAASMIGSDVQLLAGVAFGLCLMSWLLFKEFKLLCFDHDFGRGLGLPVVVLDGVLMTMIVVAVVVGLQAVGVVLMAAMLITPPAAARFWTDKLHVMIGLAAIFGGLSGAIGTMLSLVAEKMPTGPLIVLTATVIFGVSMLFAPRRGILPRAMRVLKTSRVVRRENVLRDVFELAEDFSESNSGEKWPGATLPELLQKRHGSEGALKNTLAELQRQKLIKNSDNRWQLTETGLREAYETVRRHRLWEMYLMHETALGAHHADRDADDVEHFLPPEVVGQLEELLRDHHREPKLVVGG